MTRQTKIRTLRTARFVKSNFFDLLICITIALVLVLLSSGAAFAQNVGINNPTPHDKALLDLTSNDKGVLVPRMTAAQRTAMFPVADATARGMLVYQTNGTQGFYYFDGNAWIHMDPSTGAAGWALDGNAGTDPATSFIGTTDAQGLAVRTGNIERMRIDAAGNAGIGTSAPVSKLQVTRQPVGYAPNSGSAFTVEGTGPVYSSILSGNHESGLLFGSSNDPQNGGIIFNAGAAPNGLQLRTGGNATRMMINAAGAVTVGHNISWSAYNFGVIAANANSAPVGIRNLDNSGVGGVHYFGSGGTLGGLTGWSNGGHAIAPGTLVHGTLTNTPASFITNSAERMRIAANGNVGIGLINPATRLHVVGDLPDNVMGAFQNTSATGYSGLSFNNGNNSARTQIGMGNATSAFWANTGYVGTNTAHPFVLTTGNQERMRITPVGNVGVGTADPQARLDLMLNSTIAQPHLRLSEIGDDFARVSFHNDQSPKFWQIAGLAHEDDDVMALNFFHNANYNLMSIRGNGNVGIGTVAPQHGLHVVRTTDNATLGLRNVNNDGVGGVNYYGAGGALGGVTGWSNNGHAVAPNSLIHGTVTNTAATFITNNTERMRLTPVGRLGIGTATPAGQVEVASNSSVGNGQIVLTETELDHVRIGLRNNVVPQFFEITALAHPTHALANFNVYHSTNGNLFTVRGDGNVGIGAAAPTTKLEVNGYTKLGSDAPAVRMRKYTGTTPATSSSTTTIPHGLDPNKILGIQAMLVATNLVYPNGNTVNGYQFDCYVDGPNIRLSLPSTGSNVAGGRTVRILITYEQ